MSDEINQQKITSSENTKKLTDLLANNSKDTVNKSMEFAKKPVYTIRNNQIIAGLIATAGLIIFALGIENLISSISQLSSPFVLIVLGMIFMAISGLFLKKMS